MKETIKDRVDKNSDTERAHEYEADVIKKEINKLPDDSPVIDHLRHLAKELLQFQQTCQESPHSSDQSD